MKCATTALCTRMAQHPDVFVCEPKEPHFFAVNRVYRRGWSWYQSLFTPANGQKAIGEGSTSYTKHYQFPRVAERIAQHLPEAKLIFIVRHPLKKIESIWLHSLAGGRVRPGSFNRQIRRDPTYIDQCRYWHQLSQYRGRFPDDQILTLFFEDFRQDPESILSRCFEFVGVDPSVQIQRADEPSNVSAEHYYDRLPLWLIRRPRWIRLPTDRWLERTSPAVRWRVRRWLQRPIPGRPRWDEDTRRWALDQIADDNRRFLEHCERSPEIWPDVFCGGPPVAGSAGSQEDAR